MKSWLPSLVFVLFIDHSFAFTQKRNEVQNDVFQLKASNCVPPTSSLDVSYNDVKMRINTNGVLWNDRSITRAAYSVGFPSLDHSNAPGVLFAGSIWIGGKDVHGQLKLAAMLYGARGNDFFSGPLSVDLNTGNYDPNNSFLISEDVTRHYGEATVNAATCVAYDRFFSVSQKQVREFIYWWECNNNIQQCEQTPTIHPETLNIILNWPAHGDETLGQDKYLAPYYDRNKNGLYDPLYGGDYPWYDFEDEVDCQRDRRTTLKGDETHWWVFNDKGNIHSESGGDPIGLEIRAQAFSFKTNNEINQATFYSYEIINRGSTTLYDTYFTQFADPDIWGSEDDYAGCDVSRGVGYAMNGWNHGTTTNPVLPNFDGSRPPAVGIDFLEGPFQDDDGKDNVGPFRNENGFWTVPTLAQARADQGIVYTGLGVGYGDGIVDNERMGMRKFLVSNRISTGGPIGGITSPLSLPQSANEFYYNMTGRLRNGQPLLYGGFGSIDSPGTLPNVQADFMFPSDSDPLGWGIHNAGSQAPWSELAMNNPPGDRRFIQSTGPFTLRPGGVNNLTVGVVYARGTNYIDSRDKMLQASTKAQALFDNCFSVVEPPHAPRLRIQELENQLVLMIDNPEGNNMNEDYAREDRAFIVDPLNAASNYDKFYRFEGYQIFQVKDASVTVDDLHNTDLARVAVQCDIQNGIGRIVNHIWEDELGAMVPHLMVEGQNAGVRHSFNIEEDLFASGTNKRLVNHKTYHFIAIAYAHNEFKPFSINSSDFDGQTVPYISSTISWDGQSIKSVAGVPHHPMPSMEGTFSFATYGTQPEITRLDGRGNMGLAVDLHPETVKQILETGISINPKYQRNRAPIDVKVIDPLNLKPGHFELYFHSFANTNNGIDTARWYIRHYDKKDGELLSEVTSERAIGSVSNWGTQFRPEVNEQIIPQWGISVRMEQNRYSVPANLAPIASNFITELVEASMTFSDSSKNWLTGVHDTDLQEPSNWILSGGAAPALNPCYENRSIDAEKRFANILGGIITHFKLIRNCGAAAPIVNNPEIGISGHQTSCSIAFAPSIDLVFTEDKSLWTRSVVIELCQDSTISQGNGHPARPRASASVDKNGLSAGQLGYNAAEGDLVSTTGMGWFPGYAIDVETGRRLNIAFGENSFLAGQNGADMLWNPTSKMYDNTMNPLFGGQHAIYVVGEKITGSNLNNWSNIVYDSCAWLHQFVSANNNTFLREAWRSVTWVMYPLLAPNHSLLESEATVKIRVKKRFENFLMTGKNGARPAFEWNMDALASQTSQKDALAEALAMINVVPNPYYAYSQYERDRFDQRIKITNLPNRCTINIYNLQGKLIRSFDKNNPTTSLDWDLRNFQGQAIAGGVYLIHIKVPDVGERVLKWFGGTRTI